MRQISILPAGCQISSKNILFSNENKIIYASTLAIYVLNAKTFVVEKVISACERTITSMCVSPHDNNLLCVASLAGDVSLWRMEEENTISRFTLQANAHMILEWDPHSPDHCAIVINHPYVRILYW
jgi:WD40 repeat protein